MALMERSVSPRQKEALSPRPLPFLLILALFILEALADVEKISIALHCFALLCIALHCFALLCHGLTSAA